MNNLVLSVFPGIDLFGRAFEEHGFCVVRGPDVLWGGDIRNFHPPTGVFGGIIGGPPCQPFSDLRHLLRAQGKDTRQVNLIPEFCRVVAATEPEWFLMENTRNAPSPKVSGYAVWSILLRHASVGGDTRRQRKFWFGARGTQPMPLNIGVQPRATILPLERSVTRNCRIPDTKAAIRAARHKGGLLPGQGRCMPIEDVCELQGLPRAFCAALPFTKESLRIMLGNGVPMAMGRALAKAVREAMGMEAADTKAVDSARRD